LAITPEKFDHERHGQQLKSGGENRRFVVVGGALDSQKWPLSTVGSGKLAATTNPLVSCWKLNK
jgi:hypothetical protein